MGQIKLSVLISARRNSKYLAKFMMGLLARTDAPERLDVHVMLSEHDTWNEELVFCMNQVTDSEGRPVIRFHREDYKLGRAGLHRYFNAMVPHAVGEWFIYFCEDHFITAQDWDLQVMRFIWQRQLDPKKIYSIIPKFDNVGAMNQIQSRGYVEALGGVLGRHGWIDSYINDLNNRLPKDRVLLMDNELFHDFTHDHPNPMDDSHTKAILSEEAEQLRPYDSGEVRSLIDQDEKILSNAIANGL